MKTVEVVISIPEEDMKFLWRLFDMYCEEEAGFFNPELWLTSKIEEALENLKADVIGVAKCGFFVYDNRHYSKHAIDVMVSRSEIH